MKKTFWLLDVNYETRNGQPELWIWGITQDGERILIIDRNFEDYFYILPKEGTDPEDLLAYIKQHQSEYPQIARMNSLDKKYFGKPVKVVKVYCQDPSVMPKYARALQKIEGVKECIEDDIRYSMRYLIDNDVIPCGWHEIEVEEAKGKAKAQADTIYEARTRPKYTPDSKLPPLRILGFSMICYSQKGTAKADRDPLVIISVATNKGEQQQFVAGDNDDKRAIKSFADYIHGFDPDIIVGFGTNTHDWQYLMTRAKLQGINFFVDKTEMLPHTSAYGHVSITGRANVDFFDYVDELPEVKLKTLENIADYLDVMKVNQRTHLDEAEYAEYWESKSKRQTLLRYSKENTASIMGIAEAMLDFAMQLSALVSLPLDHVGTAAVGFRTEWFLTREAYKINELIPKRQERPYIPYAGGMVLAPKPGMHESIAVLDFKSMYPNIMITYNISPDTYVPQGEPDPASGVNTAPEVKYRFRKEPAGFYKTVLTHLIGTRDEIREKLTKLSPKGQEYRALDARQRAVKVITNAAYGYTGWIGARWYIKQVAEAAAAWGRETIRKTIELAEKTKLQVIYSDTDSVFVSNESKNMEKLSREIDQTIGLEIRPSKVYTRVLFTEAKKRYCGLLPTGELDIVGLEVVRGDWAPVAKNVQEKVLEILLKEKSPEKASEYVRAYLTDMKEHKIPYKDFIIWKTLTKSPEEYEVRAPHVEAARLLKKEGLDLTLGDKIGYVIVKGEGKLYTKSKPYVLVAGEDLDIEYYITNQVVPAAARILSLFNVKEEELFSKPSRTSLSDFLPKSR
ncbi:MAG TPA: DNA polymerase domain-containing protein [Candidatus Bathyarchaeia archaeon]|nr:DNA polymerase domain-containing protein [Candidatus Bathyarchaeia archaeon]